MQTVNKSRRTETNRMQTRSPAPKRLLLSALIALAGSQSVLAAELQDVSFASLPGKKVEVQMQFDSAAPEPKAYMIETPPRLVLDLWDTSSDLEQKVLAVKSGDVDSLHFAEANGRTRVVANLNEVAGYNVRTDGNSLYLEIGGEMAAVEAPVAAQANQAPAAPAVNDQGTETQVKGIDFHRLEGDRGRITIDLGTEAAGLDIVEEGNNVVVNLSGVQLAGGQQRLDVQDFATPINFIDTMVDGNSSTVLIKPTSAPYDYMAYQSGSQLVLDFKSLTQEDREAQKDLFPYDGEKIDLNFQNVEIRTVLQIIAEVAEKNLVVSDNVQGDITLRLKNVPWDQALDIVLKTKGLDKREAGNVLLVGTVTEIAEREAVEMQSQQNEITVAPLVTDFIQIDYRKASDIKERLIEAKMISERGFAMADDETNTLMVRETVKQIEDIRETIKQFDVEVAQVMVQARLVTASDTAAKELGIRWGAGYKGDNFKVGGSPNADPTPYVDNPLLTKEEAEAVEDADAYKESIKVPSNLLVDLGIQNATSGIAFGFLDDSFLLSAELLAMQTDGKLEIVSQPKVITTNGKPAVIKAGQEIPTRTVDSDGKATVEWKEVVLKLDVVPQIIPGDKVLLELIITEDTVGEVYDELGNRLINKQELRTSIVVSDGETVVLGGVLQKQSSESVSKTPFLGDLPVVGNLFKSRTGSSEKRELLVFITPQMIRDSLRR
ncbi:type IV pilus secretin PilQ [Marinobacterium weihaiense]|uniref:Type IV pilus secretin PilQ n=1 Tax=Marinobacterium weihaiense TaxID=2851016 RepID=A0ABS6MDE4_9GAMM|nr:type IV pilus secretin PilQ [Marinobacterium weihaiense]MBV0934326.1 type IV pilus secretin PilQ [Marinobacterium weihaiense]